MLNADDLKLDYFSALLPSVEYYTDVYFCFCVNSLGRYLI